MSVPRCCRAAAARTAASTRGPARLVRTSYGMEADSTSNKITPGAP